MEELFTLNSVCKEYGETDNRTKAIDDFSYVIYKKDIVSITGPSGAGKSTLLKVISGLERADSGDIFFLNQKYTSFTNEQLTQLRLNEFGFVFQNFNLLSSMTVRDNIFLPSIIKQGSVDQKMFEDLVEYLGISNKLGNMPDTLSGGEKQRVAIARALITSPSVIFADEPTGNLDSENSNRVFELLFNLADKLDKTLIYVTHERDKAQMAQRKIVIKDGKLSESI